MAMTAHEPAMSKRAHERDRARSLVESSSL